MRCIEAGFAQSLFHFFQVFAKLHPPAQGETGRQHIHQRQLGDTGGHRHIDIGVFRHIHGEHQVALAGQRRILGGHADDGGIVFAGQRGNLDQRLGAAGVGDEHHHIPLWAVDAAHAHHDDVIKAHYRDVEAEEFVLGIAGDGRRGAKAEEADLLGLGQDIDAAIDGWDIQAVFGRIQAGHGGFEDLGGIGIGAVFRLYVTVHIGCTIGQALGQVQFEIGKTLGIETTTKTVDGRFTDVGHFGQGGDAGVNGSLGRRQDHLGDLAFWFTETFQVVCNFIKGIHHHHQAFL